MCDMKHDFNFLLKTPYVFDVHIYDIFVPFVVGGTLVISVPGAHRDAALLAQTITNEKCNSIFFVPTLLNEFLSHLDRTPEDAKGVRENLKRLMSGGEALMSASCHDCFRLMPDTNVYNLYGPTEASVAISYFACTKESLGTQVGASIGKPLRHIDFRIMDPTKYDEKVVTADLLEEVPDGVVGELWVGGDCLASGYINDPTKTEAAFFNFPDVQPHPARGASPFTLYKTGDLVRRCPDGNIDYLGRVDFQVKIGGVRIECEEVSSVLKTHWAVQDCLVRDFEGPVGKALAAYVVVDSKVDWQAGPSSEETLATGDVDADELIAQWTQVYDEMYQDSGAGVSEEDPTLNWSGYTDTYTRNVHVEPVIKEWVEMCCELCLRHEDTCFPAGKMPRGRAPLVIELGCGNGMLLFRIAPIVTASMGGRYIGTDISVAGLSYINKFLNRGPPYGDLAIETKQIAAHEILTITEPRSTDVVLCNGVTMYFPTSAYLSECMQTAVEATCDGGVAIFGDIQSKRHLVYFHTDTQIHQALRNPGATVQSVLSAARKAAANEGLNYFDDSMMPLLERASATLFGGRVARFEMRVKRGWWHSEFSRFRYDVELVVEDSPASEEEQAPLKFERRSFAQVCEFLEKPCIDELVFPSDKLVKYVTSTLAEVSEETDSIVVTLPNARTLRPVRLLAWMLEAESNGSTLQELPKWLRSVDVEVGHRAADKVTGCYGVEPEALFEMQMPEGWKHRVIFAEDPAMLELVLLKKSAAKRRWLSSLREVDPDSVSTSPSTSPHAAAFLNSPAASPASAVGETAIMSKIALGKVTIGDFELYKNRPEDYKEPVTTDPAKVCHDELRSWAMSSSLLPVMRPSVYVKLDEFPKTASGKVDRAQLPKALNALELFSDT